MSRNTVGCNVIMTLSVAVMFGSTVSHAQGTSGGALPEIVVTAQKREERLLDVPISIAVVSGQVLDEFKVTAMDDIDRLVPNLYVQNTPGSNAFYLRGIGSTPGNLAVEASVGLFVDGVYGGRSRQFMLPFFDIEQVEVLRGPQGAAFGVNTSAGAVSITSAKPTKDLIARVSASYEFEFDSYEVGTVVSGPLTDQLQGRIAVQYQDIGGYMQNTVTGDDSPEYENTLMRGSLAWQPTENLSASLKLEHANFDMYGNSYQRILLPEYIDDDKLETAGFGQKDVDKTDATNLTLRADYSIAEGTLTSITGISKYDYDKYINADAMPTNTWLTRFQEDFQQFSQEFRFVSVSGGKFDYVVGGYFQHNEIDPLIATTRTIFPTTAGPFNGTSEVNYQQDDQMYSVFGSLGWNFLEHWRLVGDLRYTDDDKDATQQRQVVSGVLPPNWGAQRLDDSRSDTSLDPGVKLQWLPSDDLMFYASYAEGSKSGTWQGSSRDVTAANWDLDGESSENYEVGVKAKFLDGRAFISATIFDTDFDDLQVSRWNGTSFSVANAAKANSQGVEVDGQWRISDAWYLHGGFAYLDAKYDDFPGAPCPFDDPTCNPATNNLAGTRLGFAPEWSGNLSVSFEHAIVNSLLLKAIVAVQYRDDVWLDTAGDAGPDYNKQDATTWIDGRLSVSTDDNRWTIALYGKNLTDEQTISHNFPFPFPADVIAGRQTYINGTDRFREIGAEVIFSY
jgi:iron complex outermembrane receptor protein